MSSISFMFIIVSRKSKTTIKYYEKLATTYISQRSASLKNKKKCVMINNAHATDIISFFFKKWLYHSRKVLLIFLYDFHSPLIINFHICVYWMSVPTPGPTSSVGVTNVRHGFSIPPYGKEGGRIRRS